MDKLHEVAMMYAKLFNKDFFYTLETGHNIHVYFEPGSFHHVSGLHKLSDIPLVTKGARNTAAFIFHNILKGNISLTDIQKSRYFNEIEPRLRHFGQINRLIEYEKIIIDFDHTIPVSSKLEKADYVLFKRSNDNMYLNLFLMKKENKQIPLTFLPEPTDYYTRGQKTIRILSMTEMPRVTKSSSTK